MSLGDRHRGGFHRHVGGIAIAVLAAGVLAGLTCWATGINPLPHAGHVQDPGWFLTFGAVYFVAGLVVLDKVRRRK